MSICIYILARLLMVDLDYNRFAPEELFDGTGPSEVYSIDQL